MKRQFKNALLVVGICAVVAAVLTPSVEAMLQRPTGTVVSGTTSAGVPGALLINSSGALLVDSTPSGAYPTPYESGYITLLQGSTGTITSTATIVTALTTCNVSFASVTVNIMDSSSHYIYPPSFVIPAGQCVGFPVGAGLLYSGITASASVANAASINVGGNQ